MISSSAAIVFINNKHSSHLQIVQMLASEYSVIEVSLLSQSESQCSEKTRIDELINNLKVLVVYLSKETKNNSCVCYFLEKAVEHNIKIIGIWIENVVLGDMINCMVDFGDVVTNYPCDLPEIIHSDFTPWVDSDGKEFDKKIIKKHTCG